MATASQCGPSAKVSSPAALAVPEKDDDTDTKSRIGDEYILVKKSKSIPIPVKDEKADLSIPKLSPSLRVGGPRSYKSLLHSTLKGKSRGNGPQVRVTLYRAPTTASGGAGLAVGGFLAVIPSAASEWSSYADLYDEVKVIGGRLHFSAADAVTGSTLANREWAIGYDPAYDTVPTSSTSVVESTQHIRGATSFSDFVGSNIKVIGSYEKHGICTLDFKCPSTPVFISPADAQPNNYPGGWMACKDPSDSAGYLRYFIAAPGGSTVTSLLLMAEYDCIFRIRT
jgi:hypothetical protein